MKRVLSLHFVLGLAFILSIGFSRAYTDISYDVKFEGLESKEAVALLKSVSQLVILEEHPPSTITGLSHRAEADIPNLIQGLHSLGYFDAKASVEIDEEECPVLVIVTIETGPVYTLSCFNILPPCADDDDEEEEEASEEDEDLEEEIDEEDEEDDEEEIVRRFPLDTINPKDLGIICEKPALPKNILDAEKALLLLMARKAYPLAKILKRTVVADYATKTVAVTLIVDSGPCTRFGPVFITGQECVEESFIRKKIAWCEGKLYHPRLIEKTQLALESSGLFSSATIKPAEELDENGQLPVDIELIEGRHRTIGFGASYNTELGPGVTAEWEHRNMRGLGEKLSLRADIWQKLQRGTMLYSQPDFNCPGQDLLWLTEIERQITKGFTESFFSFSGIVNRKIGEKTEFSYGGSFKQLNTKDSNNNGPATLIKAPIQWKWSNANNLLNPTKGRSLNIKVTPTYKVNSPQMTYCINTLTGTYYYPFDEEQKYVLAAKLDLGSIFGASDRSIPPPERFYAGSENTLRGYQYLTVSPLNHENKPIGGRSLMIGTLEMRARVWETIGGVLFYDVGNVYSAILPQFDHKQLQSVGFGVRYHTPVGPLRADFSVPLNPRKGLDKHFQIYFSIGQAF